MTRPVAADPAALRPAASPRERRLAESGALLVMVFWAANFIVVKAANAQIPPVTFSFLRFGLASLVLLGVLRMREGSIGLPRRDLVRILALGGLGFGVYQILWPIALQSIPAGDSALLIAATPVLTAILAGIAGSDTLSPTKLAGALVSFAGVAIVIAAGAGLAIGASIAGDLLTLLAALCFSIYTSFASPLLRRFSPLRVTTLAMVGGSIVLLVPGLYQAAGVHWETVSAGAWAGLLYSSLIPAGLSNVIVFTAIRLLGPTPVTALQSLVPFLAVLMGAAFLAEQIRPEQIVGGIVIIAGVLLTRAGSSVALRLRELLPYE